LEIKRAVVANTDVILFNIDSKADHRTGRDLILRVFLKVLNELQGYSGDHPHVAHMERYLESKNKLKAFHIAYEKHTGQNWLQERDAYQFNRDEVAKALSETLGHSRQAAEMWVDGAITLPCPSKTSASGSRSTWIPGGRSTESCSWLMRSGSSSGPIPI
jgi:hypothetical protein